MQNKTAKFIVNLIELAKLHSDEILKDDTGPSSRSPFYRKEMRTFALRAPRRFGHTTAALDLLAKYPDSAIIVPSVAVRDHIYRPKVKTTFLNRIFVAEQLVREIDRMRGLDPTFIVMDIASYITFEQKDTLYKFFPSQKIFWVELG